VADARAWLLWALTILLAASYNRNPLYSFLLLLVTLWGHAACVVAEGERGAVGDADPEALAPLAPLRFALVAVPLAALFNVLASHVGATVLFRLPDWLPLIGGAVTLEALVFGAINGLNLTVIFVGFMTFNRALTVRDLLQLTPRAFHESGVVLSIALTFAPQTLQSLRRIREAQAVRGHRVRGVRDWAPILTPLLVSALERALALAESMVARGYASVATEANLRTQILLVFGLVTLLGGWLLFLFAPAARVMAVGGLVLGAGLLSGAMWIAGRGVRHTVYRPRRWRWRDTLMVAGCLPMLALLLTRRSLVTYTPYPALTWPAFAPLVGVSVLGLLMPALLLTWSMSNREQR
jgi:energy-coupling factor transport system permease protein